MIVALSETNSPVRAESRSAFPSAYRCSTRIFLPSVYPKSAKPDRKASSTGRIESSVPKWSQPIVGTVGCWVRARLDQTVAAPAIRVMNARRLFDDLVGAGEQRGRDRDAQRLRSLEVDH